MLTEQSEEVLPVLHRGQGLRVEAAMCAFLEGTAICYGLCLISLLTTYRTYQLRVISRNLT